MSDTSTAEVTPEPRPVAQFKAPRERTFQTIQQDMRKNAQHLKALAAQLDSQADEILRALGS